MEKIFQAVVLLRGSGRCWCLVGKGRDHPVGYWEALVWVLGKAGILSCEQRGSRAKPSPCGDAQRCWEHPTLLQLSVKVLKRFPGTSEEAEMGSEESRTKPKGQRVQTGSSWDELDLLLESICFKGFFFFPKLGIPALKVCSQKCWQVSSAGLGVPSLLQNVV